MNMQTPVVTHESVLKQLTETMRTIAGSAGRTPEAAVEALQAHFDGHLYVSGRFTTKPTLWKFPEITFEGEVVGEHITHTIWCY